VSITRGGRWRNRRIELPARSIDVGAPVSAVMEDFRSRLTEMPGVICQVADTVVARFSGRVGPYRGHTVEVVRFEVDSLTFEHLAGPFRACHEIFAVRPDTDDTAIVEHRGWLVMKFGPLGWLAGLLLARPAFDRVIARELQGLADRLGDAASAR
jgi:hypothetical protein